MNLTLPRDGRYVLPKYYVTKYIINLSDKPSTGGEIIYDVKSAVCFVLELAPSPLCGAIFKTKHTLNL